MASSSGNLAIPGRRRRRRKCNLGYPILDVGRQSRILNTTQNWVVSKAFAPLLIRRVHGDNVTIDTKLIEDNDKLGQGKC